MLHVAKFKSTKESNSNNKGIQTENIHNQPF